MLLTEKQRAVLEVQGHMLVTGGLVPAKPQSPSLDRIVQSNLGTNVDEETRQNFRVAITRARQKTLILTPYGDPCVLLKSGSALYPDLGLNDCPRDLFNKLDSVRPIQCRLVDAKRNCAMQAAPKQKR